MHIQLHLQINPGKHVKIRRSVCVVCTTDHNSVPRSSNTETTSPQLFLNRALKYIKAAIKFASATLDDAHSNKIPLTNSIAQLSLGSEISNHCVGFTVLFNTEQLIITAAM